MGVLGNVAKHMLGSLARAIRMTALTFIIVAIIAALATEGLSWLMTNTPPTGPSPSATPPRSRSPSVRS
jgi:carbon starvation protein CstA